ncbi:hypothetical protein ALC57_09421, partial [Trachymyrmex cornetzi]
GTVRDGNFRRTLSLWARGQAPATAARDWALPASRSPGSHCKPQCESVYECVCVKLCSLSFSKGPVSPLKATSKYSSVRGPQTRPPLAPSQFHSICFVKYAVLGRYIITCLKYVIVI